MSGLSPFNNQCTNEAITDSGKQSSIQLTHLKIDIYILKRRFLTRKPKTKDEQNTIIFLGSTEPKFHCLKSDQSWHDVTS